jgi:hypothetical protein
MENLNDAFPKYNKNKSVSLDGVTVPDELPILSRQK